MDNHLLPTGPFTALIQKLGFVVHALLLEDWSHSEALTGVIKLTHIGGIKEYKCMVILSDLPIKMHCLGW